MESTISIKYNISDYSNDDLYSAYRDTQVTIRKIRKGKAHWLNPAITTETMLDVFTKHLDEIVIELHNRNLPLPITPWTRFITKFSVFKSN